MLQYVLSWPPVTRRQLRVVAAIRIRVRSLSLLRLRSHEAHLSRFRWFAERFEWLFACCLQSETPKQAAPAAEHQPNKKAEQLNHKINQFLAHASCLRSLRSNVARPAKDRWQRCITAMAKAIRCGDDTRTSSDVTPFMQRHAIFGRPSAISRVANPHSDFLQVNLWQSYDASCLSCSG
jgi:hypothetical protein